MSNERLLYQIGITLIPNIGDVLAKNLVSYCGGVKAVFDAPYAKLIKVPGIGPATAKAIVDADILDRAEEEIKFVEKNKVKTLFYLDDDYPFRLKQCYDNPVLLYYKGNADLNAQKILAIVGTRKATPYGTRICEQLVEGVSKYDILIVSGLAYGIDICAHKAALENGLSTVGVLGHGLHTIYPAHHRTYASRMVNQGGLLTEFLSNSKFEKENFPRRNRIIAGLADGVLVVETKTKGGSIITAEIANSYSREVMAVPGNVGAKYSEGCNFLIKRNKAGLVDSVEELVESMGWDTKVIKKVQARELLLDLEPREKSLVDLLKDGQQLRIDEISYKINMPSGEVATGLLNLELKGIVRSLPGKLYQLVN